MKWVEIKPQNFVFLAKHPCRSKMKIATSHKGAILIDVWNAGFLQWRHCREATEVTLICAGCVFAAVNTYSWFLLFIRYYISRFIFFWRVLLCFFIDKSFCYSPWKMKLAKALDPPIWKFLTFHEVLDDFLCGLSWTSLHGLDLPVEVRNFVTECLLHRWNFN